MKRLILILGIAFVIPFVGLPKDVKALDSYVTYDQLKAYQEKEAENEWSRQLTQHAQTLVGKKTGQCVLALRNYFGVSKSTVQGYAKTTKITSKEGKIGAVIVFKNLSKWGHVGIVVGENENEWIYFHSNYDFRGHGRIDKINKKDSHISGFNIK